MTWNLDRQAAAVSEALAFDSPQRVGWFRFYFDSQRWEWSDEVHRIHGYQPGTVDLSTDLVLSHKHPDDRARVADVISDMIHNRVAFSTRHRIVDTSGTDHQVVVVGDLFCDDDGEAVGTHGFYVDVTPLSPRDAQNFITTRVAAIARSRGAIEQTKGILMFVYDIDEPAAFKILKSLSQANNTKLGRLAEQIAADFRSIRQTAIGSLSEFDQLLFTAYQRVDDSADLAQDTSANPSVRQ